MTDVARMSTILERGAGEFHFTDLIVSNLEAFHARVGETLCRYDEYRLIAPDASWQLQHFHTLVMKYNLHLDKQSQLFPPSSRKASGLGQDKEEGARPDGNM
jgi:hypothetical protein